MRAKRRVLSHILLFTAVLLLSAFWLFVMLAIWGGGRIAWGNTFLLPKNGPLPVMKQVPKSHYLLDFAGSFRSNLEKEGLLIYLVVTGLPCIAYALTALLPDTLHRFFPKQKVLRVLYACIAAAALLFSVFCAIGAYSRVFERNRTAALKQFLTCANLDLIAIGVGLSVVGWLIPCFVHRLVRSVRERTVPTLALSGIKRTVLGIVSGFLITAVSGLLLACLSPFSKDAVRFVEKFCTRSAGYDLPFFVTLVMAPFMEELAFRGMIQRNLRKYAPAWLAILITALFFGIWHRNTGQFVYTFVVALLLGWVFELTGMVRYTVLIHFSMNFFSAACFSTWDTAILGRLHILPRIRETLMGLPVWAAVLLLLLLTVVLTLLVRGFRKVGNRSLRQKLFGSKRANGSESS